MREFSFVLVLVTCSSLWYWAGKMNGFNEGEQYVVDGLKNGELACCHVRDEAICWNPKEEEK